MIATLAKFYGWPPNILWSMTWREISFWCQAATDVMKGDESEDDG